MVLPEISSRSISGCITSMLRYLYSHIVFSHIDIFRSRELRLIRYNVELLEAHVMAALFFAVKVVEMDCDIKVLR